jgi:hypothetical protein
MRFKSSGFLKFLPSSFKKSIRPIRGSFLQLNCISSQIRPVDPLRKCRLLMGSLAGALLVQFALMLAMSSWAPLHHHLHCDDGQPDHHCEVTLWQSGSVETTAPVVATPRPAAEIVLPSVLPLRAIPVFTATQFLGGVLAQGPPRGP